MYAAATRRVAACRHAEALAVALGSGNGARVVELSGATLPPDLVAVGGDSPRRIADLRRVRLEVKGGAVFLGR